MYGKKPRIRHRKSWKYLVLVSLVSLAAFTLIMETFFLLGPRGGTYIGLHKSIGLAWRNYFSNHLLPEEAISDEDLLHHALLREVCIEDTNVSLPWQFGSPGKQGIDGTATNSHVLMHETDQDLLQKLRQCPDIDIFLPSSARTYGYCEDAAAYVKYLESRLLPEWIMTAKLYNPDLKRKVDYFDLCPKTPMLFLDHHWGGMTESPRWPKDKPVYMMANIEIMELTPMHFLRADAVLCKSFECYKRVMKWFEQYGNRRDAQVFYTKHTSSSLDLFALKRLAGASQSKGTREVLECWVETPGLPPLDVYIDREPFNRLLPLSFRNRIPRSKSPVTLHLGMLKPLDYSKVISEASFVVNPSYGEGYGHIINQARATGAVIVTTDMSPMNEIIIGNGTGMLVSVQRRKHPMVVLGGNYRGTLGLENVDGLVASFAGSDVCSVIERVVQSSYGQRVEMGFKARRQYHADTKYFAKTMQELRNFAKR
ncbi:unnamed protein product [Peronospora belbahrii]|uniref:Glycosyl transferase family 1 domain-containing protein n=1 Tax=Peronospora belbahrii TaxID=622444 RepID=A0AAU9KSC7_9STRA|nr:unnamed protein product [Peronospora belbahrii]